MPTFKTVIRGYRRADNTYSVYIRVTHNRKVGYIKTIFSLEKHEVTNSGKIKNHDVLDMCDDKIRQYRKKCNKYGDRIRYLSVSDIIKLLETKEDGCIDFFNYSSKKIEEINNDGRTSTAKGMNATLNVFKKFIGKDYIQINSITSNLCRDFFKYLEKGGHKRRQTFHLSNIRTLFNMALNELNDEDLDVIEIKVNPFKKFKIPQQRASERERSINSEQIKFIYDFPYTENGIRINMAKDVFMLSFFLVGMNTVDLYKLENYDGEYISYNRSKTSRKREDNSFIRIKVPIEAKGIIEKYRGWNTVFNFCQNYATHNGFNQNVNIGLKELSKKIKEKTGIDFVNLTSYVARHSWATIARNDVCIDKYIVHEALNHSDSTMKITDIYIKKDFSHIDRANRKVIDFVLNKKTHHV